MKRCCPPGRGCNSPTRDEPCVLEMCREAEREEPTAALAVARWEAWQHPTVDGETDKGPRRFRRRAYERARDEALAALLMRSRVPGARGPRAHERAPTSRLGVLLRQHQGPGRAGRRSV